MSEEAISPGDSPRRVLFREEQRFRQWWIWTVLGLADARQVLIGSGRAEALAATVAGIRPKGEC